MIPPDGRVALRADRRGLTADRTTESALATAPTTLLITNRADAARLRASLAWPRTSLAWPAARQTSARLAVPALEGAERVRTELALDATLHDCGCTAGSVVLTIAVLAYLALLRFAPAATPAGAHPWLAGIAVALVAGVAGKGVGLLLARLRLLRRLRALELRLPD